MKREHMQYPLHVYLHKNLPLKIKDYYENYITTIQGFTIFLNKISFILPTSPCCAIE